MKRPAVKYTLELLLFFVLIAGALLLMAPLSVRVEKGLAGFRDTLMHDLEKRTGLRFSYAALSPSIFRSLKLTDLVVTDASNGTVIAQISSVSISYDILEVLRGDFAGSLREVVIENGSIMADNTRNNRVVTLIKNLAKGNDGSQKGTVAKPAALFFNHPFIIRIRNLDIGYSDSVQEISAHIVRGSAEVGQAGISFDLNSRLRYDRPSLVETGSLSAGITLKGSIDRTLDSGSASLVIQSFESSLFSVSRLGLVTSYRSGILSVSSVQDLQPVDISLVWNIPENDITVALQCEKLLPLQWIHVRNESSLLSRLKNTSVSGAATLRLSEKNGFEYAVNMKSEIPSSVYSGGEVSVNLEGNEASVKVKKIAVNGENYDMDFSGSVDLKKRIPDGFLSIKKMILPSGACLEGDLYLQPQNSGFVCIAPEFSVNGTKFTSVKLQLASSVDSVEFSFSAFDSTGRMSANGNLSTGKNRFLQFYAAFDSVSVADIANSASGFIIPDKTDDRKHLSKILAPYALTTEVYFSSNFSDFSFNCTRLVLASAEKDGLYILLSAKGNENGVDIYDIAFSHAGYTIAGNVSAGFESSGGILFNSSMTVNNIPYSISGMYSNRSLSVYGDYNLAISALFDDFGGITGSFKIDSFPVPAGPMLLSCSLDSRFVYTPAAGWKATIDSGTVEDVNKYLPLSTVFAFEGTVNESGVFLEKLTLSDTYSTVTGYAGLNILPDSSGGSQYTAEVALKSPEGESFTLNGRVMTGGDELYLSSEIKGTAVPLMRFLHGQEKDSLASFSFSLSGTPSNLMVSADLVSLRYQLAGYALDAHGKLLLEDRTLSLYDAAASWNGHTFKEIKASRSADNGQAHLDAKYNGFLGSSGVSATIGLDFIPGAAGDFVFPSGLKSLLDRYTMRATFSDVHWNTINPVDPIVCTFVHEPGITAVYAGKNDVISGFLLDDGTFSLHSGEGTPVRFQADGGIVNSALSINVADVHVDLAKLWPLTGLGIVQFDSGSVDGSFTITGLLDDPEFNGKFQANGVLVEAPGFVNGVYGSAPFEILAEGKTFSTPDVMISGKDGAITAKTVMEFDRWDLATIKLKAATLPGQLLRLDTENQYFKANGYASCDLDMTVSNNELKLEGDTSFERGYFAIMFSGFLNQSPSDGSASMDYLVNLNLHVGKKVEFRWPNSNFPILRGLIQAEKPVEIRLDTAHNSFHLKGEANLKGGEIYYIKRSFYLRQGNIVFNENQDIFDPIITLRAEIRERDEDGKPVRVILSVDKQPISSFVPVLTSDPLKTDAEIMVLLGQAASGDTSRDTLLQNTVITASDIFSRMSLFRNAENGVRDLMGLDVFSIRTLLLQNAIFGSALQSHTDQKMSIGNYFDNTTVYMGKYLGSAIYTDALLHFSYYDPVTTPNSGGKQIVYGNLLFQPEIGLEVTTPFFLLRWGITPENPETLFVSDNSVTLSWKFSY